MRMASAGGSLGTRRGDRGRSRGSAGRGRRGMRASKARAGHRAGKACHRRWSAYGRLQALRRQTPEVGAVCGKAARTDLCGGRAVMDVPTAILLTFVTDYNRTRLRYLDYQAAAELLAKLAGHNTFAGAGSVRHGRGSHRLHAHWWGWLWERLGIAEVLGELLASRGFEFAVERAVFASVLHRLFESDPIAECITELPGLLKIEGS